MPVSKWIKDFEDLAVLLKWNDLQKVIYGKRMLSGSAKKFISYEKGVINWATLKKCLIGEFKTEVNSAVLHTRLVNRKRKPDETGRQYIYAMQEIASRGCIEDDALIQHVINGI